MININLYEFNQMGYNSLPNYDEEDFNYAEQLIRNFLNKYPSKYYLLLNNDLHYYTFFVKNGIVITDPVKEILSIVKELGNVKSIEIANSGDAIEFWINTLTDKECHMFLLFDYALGVIEI